MDADALTEGVTVAGRYRIRKLLGKGGMGAVYEAQHEELGRLVALKVLLPQFARDSEIMMRFLREARAAATIHHPGIVEVFDLGRDGDLAFIVMERLEGEELAERIRYDGRLGPKLTASIGADIAEAVAAAHGHGIIHRDLKPQNVFLVRRGRGKHTVKILDFGIAKLIDGETEKRLTRTGQVFGTPLYMPPEQLHGKRDVDARADVYAMGAILYEALSGNPPFEADSYPSLVLKIVTDKPRSLAELRDDVSPALRAVIERAMAKERDERFATAADMAQALAELAETLPADPPVPEHAPMERRHSDTSISGVSEAVDQTANSLPRVTPFDRGFVADRASGPPVASAEPHARAAASPPRSRAGLIIGAVVGLVGLSVAVAAITFGTLQSRAMVPVAPLPVPAPVARPAADPVAAPLNVVAPAPAPVPVAVAVDAGVAVARPVRNRTAPGVGSKPKPDEPPPLLER